MHMSSQDNIWAGLALSAVATVLALLFLELGFRLATGVPAFSYENWRLRHVEANRLDHRATFDPLLGWSNRAHYTSDGFNTLEHGIRRNFDERDIRTNAILAVGDSFTEGWDDVRDEETWPAQLERLTGTPVVNGGVGGYGTDQIILRAEQLLEIVRPKALIVGFFEEDILRAGYAPYGGPKPYFTLENGKLLYHPPQIESGSQIGTRSSFGNGVREVLGYSVVADLIFGRLAPTYWYAGANLSYRKVGNDPVAVTCALLGRLKVRADASRIPVLLFMQHGWAAITENDQPSDNAQRVTTCAGMAGVEVVDEFASLRTIAATDAEAFKTYYTMEGNTYWHMSAKGNMHAAELIARGLQD